LGSENELLFSVVITTHDRPQLLERAVRSVLDQTITDFECIVVDDAGSPPCQLTFDDPRLRVVRRETNGGSAAARNSGLRIARGRYVTFLDDDDWFLPRRLEMVLQPLERAPVVICGTLDAEGRPSRSRELEGDVSGTIFDSHLINVGATTVARDVVPEFDESMRAGEDAEWWLRLAAAAPVTTVREPGLGRDPSTPKHPLKSSAQRASAREKLLRAHQAYFAQHPRAAAYQWRRVGRYAAAAGDYRRAIKAHARSFVARPSWLALRLVVTSSVRALRPRRRPSLP
jgi:hypothetical protein